MGARLPDLASGGVLAVQCVAFALMQFNCYFELLNRCDIIDAVHVSECCLCIDAIAIYIF